MQRSSTSASGVAGPLSTRIGSLMLKHPVICGSGEHVTSEAEIVAAIDAGAAAVVAKSAGNSHALRRQLDDAAYGLLAPDWSPADPDAPQAGLSLLNRSGLLYVEPDAWAAMLARADRAAAERDAYAIASVLPSTREDGPALARCMSEAGVRWVELNLSAPHATEARDRILRVEDPKALGDIVRAVREVVAGALTVKLTSETSDVAALAAAAFDAGADSVCLCGRRMGFLPDPETQRPVLDTFGAIGGSWELPLTLRWIAKTRERCGAEASIIGTGGARCGLDVVRFLLAGAAAVQLTTAIYAGGFAALSQALSELESHVRERATSVAQLIGVAADSVLTYDEVTRNRSR